jgi:hypothetical protein
MSEETSTLLGSGGSLNKGQAVDLLLNVNAPEEASEDTQEPVAEEVETEEVETEEAETSEDESYDDDAEEPSESEEEDDDEEYDVDEDEVEVVADDVYTVKVDGEEKQVTSEELVKSYQLEQAAQKRMQEASQTRKQAEAEAQQLAQQREQYAQALQMLEAQLTQVQEPPKEYWEKLYQEDPLEWTRQRDAYRDRKEHLAKVQQEQQRVQQEQQQQMLQAHQQKLVEEQNRLLERIPEWRDEERATREKQAIISYAQRIGYTEQELAVASDSRAIEALRKAYLYDELMAKRPEAQKKVKKAPKAVKAGTPKSKKQVASDRNKQAFDRLRKTGSKDAAVDYLLQRNS